MEKLLPSGENLFILSWRLRFVALAVLLEGWWGGRGGLGKCSVSLFQISVGQYLLPENHFSKCPGNVWTKKWAGGWTRKCLIPQCSFAFFLKNLTCFSLISPFPSSLTSLWAPRVSLHLGQCSHPEVPQLSWTRAMHKAWVEGAEPRLKLQLNRCSWTSWCWLTWHIQSFKYIISVFATGVCSDQERRNQCGQEVFFLKEKQKEGQKSDGVSSSLLESEESRASYN